MVSIKNVIITVLVAISLLSCGKRKQFNVQFNGLNNDQIDSILDALDSGLDYVPNRVMIFSLEDLPGEAIGSAEVDANPCNIKLDPSLWFNGWKPSGLLRGVIWHEYGHCVGLGHSDNPKSIMYWQASFSYSEEEKQIWLQQVKEKDQLLN